MEKQSVTQQKHTFTNQNKCTTTERQSLYGPLSRTTRVSRYQNYNTK